ncbi:MAG: hypothetical protein LBE62_13455 [Azonexus sp.]|jgi:hypothetical protein|nr:hypothetical protein [Azonexus sp.]
MTLTQCNDHHAQTERLVLRNRRLKAASASSFRLSKFYLDCISDTGDALIVYAARAEWRGLKFSYVSLLESAPGLPTRMSSSLRAYAAPAWRDGSLCFDFAPLKISARWQTENAPTQYPLLKTSAGEVIWTCLAPRARATINHRGKRIEGSGYAEHLLLTIPPWQLPIKDLHWGRFHSATDSLVWIKWLGEQPLDLTLHNGVALDAPSEISADHVRVQPLTLTLSDTRELCVGRIATTALWPLRKIISAFPSSILNLHESKWISAGTLHHDAVSSGMPECGYALHEHVIFPARTT